MVLLSILRVEQPYGLEVRRELESATDRSVSRGGFYTTLDRLERKGYLRWVAEVPENARREATQRRFSVTPEGITALRTSKRALTKLWNGLDQPSSGVRLPLPASLRDHPGRLPERDGGVRAGVVAGQHAVPEGVYGSLIARTQEVHIQWTPRTAQDVRAGRRSMNGPRADGGPGHAALDRLALAQ
ncbi:MAG TPA: PadR family transcriptional regulator [Gemmatimonadetes bacterium]|nr:PadR family transcriptional regulator [Gemmatimonadota bacterium]